MRILGTILKGASRVLKSTKTAAPELEGGLLRFAENPISRIKIPKGSLAAPKFKTEVTSDRITLFSESGENLGFASHNGGISELFIASGFPPTSLEVSELVSLAKGKGVGTRLIEELVRYSKKIGLGGNLHATASPYNKGVNAGRSNLGFYYKMGFRATDDAKHLEIQKLLDEGKDIPLSLNCMTDIYLTPEGIQKALRLLDTLS